MFFILISFNISNPFFIFSSLVESFNKFLEPLYKKSWITYIEPPKGKPENVIEYIGRYSFRVAISNDRIKNIENGYITFEYKDYKDNSKIKTAYLSGGYYQDFFAQKTYKQNGTPAAFRLF